MNTNLSEQEAIDLAKKALKDIGHWEAFKVEHAQSFDSTPPYDYQHWLVSFNFTEQDWFKGEITPTVIVNVKEELVTFVSWKKSSFLLSYNKVEDKYYHPKLSREQKDIE